MKGNIAATVLIVVGIFALLTNLDLIHIDLRALLSTWWPLILIAIGVGLFLTPNRIDKK